MTPAAHVTTQLAWAGSSETHWNLYIGDVFIACTINPNQADLYRRIAEAWNNA